MIRLKTPMGRPELTVAHWIPDVSGLPLLAAATVGGRLRQIEGEVPDSVALVEGIPTAERRRWTYLELLTDAKNCGRLLLKYFEPGEHVAVCAHNIPELRLVDPTSLETVPTGTPGAVWARGYFTMLGYFDDPRSTNETLRDGEWVRTGDVGTMDERGYLSIVGRLKDMIIRGGENLFPAEIEDVLYHHPAVAEVAVVGLPDGFWGETVGAFTRLTDADSQPTVAELRAYMRAHLSPQKTPTRWYGVTGFPLNGSGKIQKFIIREAWEHGEYDDSELRNQR